MSEEQPKSEIAEGEKEEHDSEKKEEDNGENKKEDKEGSEQEIDTDFTELGAAGKELMEALVEIANSFDELQEEIRKAGGLSGIDFEQALFDVIAAGHTFDSVDPDTGRIHGSVDGNVLFGMDGTDNSLGGTGKVILDNMVSGKFKRNVKPFVSTVPGSPAFHLDFQKERARCLRRKVLFKDPQFKTCESNLFRDKDDDGEIKWLRPGEIVSKPRLLVEGHSRFDVNQGAIGDCWFIAAVASLTLRDELFYRVVPPDQSFTENYAGIFHFQFWRYGEWVDVVIDDRLPTRDGELLYMRSGQTTEFWSALLEKAYAKLYGTYAALDGGCSQDALEDFTGGLTEVYEIKEIPKMKLLGMIMRGLQMGSMFACAVLSEVEDEREEHPYGLVRNHAYSVTGLQTVNAPSGETVIIRLRNPWGGESEWKGAWSDKAPEWKDVSEEQKAIMKVAHDGEFWMSFDDFLREFSEVEVCNLGAEVMNEVCEMTGVKDLQQKTWYSSSADGVLYRDECGEVEKGDDFESEADSQYAMRVKEESAGKDGNCTFIVSVIQKYRREQMKDGLENVGIGFAVYQWNALTKDSWIDRDLLMETEPLVVKEGLEREMTGSFQGPPGTYVIQVLSFDKELKKCKYDEDVQAEFHLRVFATSPVELTELL